MEPGPSCRADVSRLCGRFEEMVAADPVAALQYLQTEVAEAVDHADAEQERQFQLLAGRLFSPERPDPADPEPWRAARSQLFDRLTVFFPTDMAQPRSNLTDLIRLDK